MSPLSAPPERKHLHTRHYEFQGYQRTDGLWDIEGRMTDTKTYSFSNQWRGEIKAGEPIHDMWIRLTLDDELVVRDIEAKTAGSPFQICSAITPAYGAMKGLKIGKGWNKKKKEQFGGSHGCTHHGDVGRHGDGRLPDHLLRPQQVARDRWRCKAADLPQHLPRLRQRRRDREEELAGVLYGELARRIRIFRRRQRRQGERVDAGLQFVGQNLVDAALAGDARLALEGGRYDLDAEVRLAAGAVAGMAFVQLRFVDDLQACGLQGGR